MGKQLQTTKHKHSNQQFPNPTDTPHTVLAVYTVFFTFLTLTGQQHHLRTLEPLELVLHWHQQVARSRHYK
jgi:hypothetical protein